MKYAILPFALLVLVTTGCIRVKTESEIKPIHITMDVNVKVDQGLEKAFGEEDKRPQSGNFKEVKDMVDRGAAGFTNLALLEAREGATDDEKILIAETNGRFMKRYEQIATESGVSVEAVQKRRARQTADRVPAGTWLQDEEGKWYQKK